jgi:hypothetical protein
MQSILDADRLTKLATARTRIDVMSATPSALAVPGSTITVTAFTDLDPQAADVDLVLSVLSQLTEDFIVDQVNGRVRAPGSTRWVTQ